MPPARGPLPAGWLRQQPGGERGLPPASGALILLGEFGRAHGLHGEVRLKSFTAEPSAIAGYGPLVDDRGRRVALTSVRPASGASPDMLIARVEGVATREAAEALNGSPLFIPRDHLTDPGDADEFFLADLIGLPVADTSGRMLGTIVAVPNYGAGDLLEIAPPDGGPSALLPFTQAFVPVVDISEGRIVANPPADVFEPDSDVPSPSQP